MNARSIAVTCRFATFGLATLVMTSLVLAGPELVEALPLTDRIVMLHLDEGHVVHHGGGMARSDERVIASPLDTAAASRPETYRVASTDDPAYARPLAPDSVGRKSKGTDFAWFADRWENGHAVNTRPDHAKEHWLYLTCPSRCSTARPTRLTPALWPPTAGIGPSASTKPAPDPRPCT